jgi:hypothetical protein
LARGLWGESRWRPLGKKSRQRQYVVMHRYGAVSNAENEITFNALKVISLIWPCFREPSLKTLGKKYFPL